MVVDAQRIFDEHGGVADKIYLKKFLRDKFAVNVMHFAKYHIIHNTNILYNVIP